MMRDLAGVAPVGLITTGTVRQAAAKLTKLSKCFSHKSLGRWVNDEPIVYIKTCMDRKQNLKYIWHMYWERQHQVCDLSFHSHFRLYRKYMKIGLGKHL